ncbi:alpha amylase catalytic region [Kribbella flavida DSM 17836]|uniref:Alpha amylase catalytic region n=1 Tax=Kribbella flavida (strain DSM 17836 / JCM 10339 / NBRC 14399) TaxID=479435 RepID=D2Q2M7_KRIFD|nr:glycoside hydrolase family 13 protein [Kribbella flavida]ADB30208.1 alpha amylase catalytic region [Kribbella flavida DSM 17836]
MSAGVKSSADWWRDAVVYQVYIASFADGDGDGLGDIAGLRARLDHVVALGADAIWVNPWYPSPMADAGYDISNHRAIDPRFGTLDDARELIAVAQEKGLRVLLDLVPNHCSDQHPWFRQALAAGPGAAARDRFLFRDGRGVDGELPPNDWTSVFNGPAWTRVTEPDGSPGQWYLHLFAAEQPDLNWNHPDVRADFEQTLRFWFDLGADGFRIDVANALFKEAGLPDLDGRRYPPPRVEVDGELVRPPWAAHPHWDRDEVHDVYRTWRAIADSYDPPKVFVAEAWIDEPSRLSRYLRPDELHTAFNPGYLITPWDGGQLRRTLVETLAEHSATSTPPTWVLSNHDVVRHTSRFARLTQEPGFWLKDLRGRPADPQLGQLRARASVLLTLALPGSVYLYQGEELGLPEVEELPPAARRDPTWYRSGGTDPGRDGSRVPLPWEGSVPPYGFSTTPNTWLPQPPDWKALTVEAQTGDPSSMLEFYRTALRLRRALPALGDGEVTWLPGSSESLILFDRAPGFRCVVNIGSEPVPMPSGRPLLASRALPGDHTLPGNAAVWLAT